MCKTPTVTSIALSATIALLCATPANAGTLAPEKETAAPEAETSEPPDEEEPEDDPPDFAATPSADEPSEDEDTPEDEEAPEDEPAEKATPPAEEPTSTTTVTVETKKPRKKRQRSDDPVLGPMPTREYIEGMNRRARGVGLGYDNGLWGSGFMQGLKVDIPFGKRVGQFFGLRVRSMFVHTTEDAYDPVINSGLELFGRGPVFYGIVRMYGGGGAWIGVRPVPTDEGGTWAITGGGHFGFELFYVRRSSFTFEFGGQGSGHHLDMDAGASAVAGIALYLGDIRKKR
jgi:hypothetical protein